MESEEQEAAMPTPEVVAVPPAADEGPVLSFSAFAATLRPAIRRDAKGHPIGIASAGHPDEIWLKHLRKVHGVEKHTSAGWFTVIDGHRGEPAHPAGMGG